MNRKAKQPHLIGMLSMTLLSIACSVGCDADEPTPAMEARETQVRTTPDGSWISLTGSIVATTEDTFTLDYGPGTVVVEMDDWDWFAEGRQLLLNDDVIVTGQVDDDFFERRTIEASSVYVRDLGTHFFASSVDEEDLQGVTLFDFEPRMEMTGKVKAISEDSFQLETGNGTIKVTMKEMPYNPLDKEGYQQVKVGDRVRVRGSLERELFQGRELEANAVITLKKDSGAS